MEKIYIQKTCFVGLDVTMNYNKDTTRLSVLVVAFLLVGSAFTFLPALAATSGARTATSSPDCATPCVNNSSPPTVAGDPYVIVGTGLPGSSYHIWC